MLRAMWTPGHGPETSLDGVPDEYRVGIPLRKLAQPQDVAEAVAFLASEAAGGSRTEPRSVAGGGVDHGVPVVYTAQPGDMTSEQRGLLADLWGMGMGRDDGRSLLPALAPHPTMWC